MYSLVQEIVKDPLATLLVIGNLVLIESLLSVDNAAVLATMVMDLSYNDRKKALKYGIFGAYFFRGLCLLFASILIKIWWLKSVGGAYLLFLFFKWLKGRNKQKEEAHKIDKKEASWLVRVTSRTIGPFWGTVLSVELMDLAFSMDNVFAAVAFSDNILIILCGVFIGILAMRFVAQGFVKLMETYPFLEGCAYAVIGLLGVKLILSFFEHFYPTSAVSEFLESSTADWGISALTICIFFLPVITSRLFNYPAKKKAK